MQKRTKAKISSRTAVSRSTASLRSTRRPQLALASAHRRHAARDRAERAKLRGNEVDIESQVKSAKSSIGPAATAGASVHARKMRLGALHERNQSTTAQKQNQQELNPFSKSSKPKLFGRIYASTNSRLSAAKLLRRRGSPNRRKAPARCCLWTDYEWTQLSGKGKVYSSVSYHQRLAKAL